MTKYIFINNQEILDEYITKLHNVPYVAIDTEFIRKNTYYARLSLIQIAYSKDFALVIDYFTNLDLTELFKIIYNPNIIKIFHAASQDLEIFYNIKGTVPKNIFDTQIACLALNYSSNISFDKLIYAFLNIKVKKSEQTSNWLQRPLTNKQIEYAAYDVLYLFELYENMLEKLKEEKKDTWLKLNFLELENISFYQNYTQDLSYFKPYFNNLEKLNYIYNLLLWRNTTAQKQDIPKNRILTLEEIKKIITIQQLNEEAISNILPNNTPKNYITEILNLENKQPQQQFSLPYILDTNQKKIYNMLKIILENQALKGNINPLLITNDNSLKGFTINPHNSYGFMQEWKYKLFGKIALDFLQGKVSLSLKDNKIQISYNS